jgi:opacity protein-like surface antigen
MSYRKTVLSAAAIGAVVMTAAHTAGAQAWNYPSFQQPRVTPREYNFGVADGGHAGTTFAFQWREGISADNQLSLDVGAADPDYSGSKFLLGGQFAHQLTTSNAQMPFDMLFTAGLNGAFGDGYTVFRVPVGVSIGHRFPLEGGMAITPYAHPRMSVDVCSICGRDGGSDSNIGLDFDLGADFQFTPQFALRLSALFSGSDYLGKQDAFGLSLAWTAPGLRR